MKVASILAIVCAVIPLLATFVLRMHDEGFSERHHSHHDTYMVSVSLTWTLVLAMFVMGALGLLLGWLCSISVFEANSSVVMGFFDAYLLVSFFCWVLLVRYKVVTYDDYMEVTPFVGRTTTVAYADITALRWTPSILFQGKRSIRVYVGEKQRALLWCALDLDQILIRMNRFEVLEDVAAKSNY